MKSLDFAFQICIASMLGQSIHTWYCFYQISNKEMGWLNIVESTVLVGVFEFYALFFLMRGRVGISSFFSCCLGVMNGYYYWTAGYTGIKLALAMLLSVIIPLAISFVAREVKAEYDIKQEEDSMEKLLKKLEDQVSRKKKSIDLNN